MRVLREFKLFVLAIVLPAVFVAAGGGWLVVEAWRRLWSDERDDLTAQAELIADSIVRGMRDGGSGEPQPGRRRPPRPSNLREHRWRESDIERVAEICDDYCRAIPSLVFEIRDMRDERIFATAVYPERPAVTGSCPLGPPLGDGVLTVARADGGVAMRKRAALLVSLGGCLVLLLVATGVGAGVLLLRDMRRERRESKMKTDFIDNVSHELNTPLAGIRLNAELLAEGRIPDEERRCGAIESILVESDRLARMVSELLDFSRIEKGTRRYNIESFDLAAFATAPSEVQSLAAISGGRARVSVKGSGAVVSADKDAVRQIGVNLVTNAVKYAEGEIEVEVVGAEMRFMDRGRGIPPGCEERIFDRFYRVDDSLTRKEGGSGLGLSLARSLARGMGGNVTYSPRHGGGSVFTLSLATAEPSAKETT